MRITELSIRGRFRIRVSPTEMAALNKIVELGLMALEQLEDDPLSTAERKARAYWKGNPFRGLPPKKPRRSPRTPGKPARPGTYRPTAKPQP